MTLLYVVIWGFIFASGSCTVMALVWSLRSGQLRDVEAGAWSIFDEDEVRRPNKRS